MAEETSPERRARLRAERDASGTALSPAQRQFAADKLAAEVAKRKADDDVRKADRVKSAAEKQKQFVKKNKITGPPTSHRTF